MDVRNFDIRIDEMSGFIICLDIHDMAHRDVYAHFQRGQYYEQETSMLFMRVLRKEDTVIDVGANAGYFSLLSANRVGDGGRVVAVEANPRNVATIRHNVQLNKYEMVSIVEAAATNRSGTLVFECCGETDSNGGVDAFRSVGDALPATGFVVEAKTLDSIAAEAGIEKIRVVKIDTEGHETAVLKGAEGLLRNGQIDFVVCELNIPGLVRFGSSQEELRETALQWGYHTFLLDHNGKIPVFVPPGVRIIQRFTANIVFSRIETIKEFWSVVENVPAATKIMDGA